MSASGFLFLNCCTGNLPVAPKPTAGVGQTLQYALVWAPSRTNYEGHTSIFLSPLRVTTMTPSNDTMEWVSVATQGTEVCFLKGCQIKVKRKKKTNTVITYKDCQPAIFYIFCSWARFSKLSKQRSSVLAFRLFRGGRIVASGGRKCPRPCISEGKQRLRCGMVPAISSKRNSAHHWYYWEE